MARARKFPLRRPTKDSAGNELLPALTPYFVMKVGHVPVIDYHRPGDPEVEELEETARLQHLAPTDCPPLTPAQINELRQTFGARW